MKISEFIVSKVARLPKGYIFTYSDLSKEVNNQEAVIKALNRMAAAGKISKLSKGKYFKPENSAFGKINPPQQQVVKDLIVSNGKITGYLTGYSIYNQLGLTTQISNIIQIGKNQIRPNFKRDIFTISFIKQKNTITKKNIPYLQLLDSIRYIKKIPDSGFENSYKRFLQIIKNLSNNEVDVLVRLALKYSPATRALLGSLLDSLGRQESTKIILNSLNPITKYKFLNGKKVNGTFKKWGIE